jgi:hypothetical protein
MICLEKVQEERLKTGAPPLSEEQSKKLFSEISAERRKVLANKGSTDLFYLKWPTKPVPEENPSSRRL